MSQTAFKKHAVTLNNRLKKPKISLGNPTQILSTLLLLTSFKQGIKRELVHAKFKFSSNLRLSVIHEIVLEARRLFHWQQDHGG